MRTRIEITEPEDFVRDILRSYPRYAIDANVSLVLSKAQVTRELLVAAPRSARERVQTAIQLLAQTQRLGVNQEWAAPVEEWLRLHPERKLEGNINLLESLCAQEELSWTVESFEYLAGMPDTPLAVTVEYQQQQNQLASFAAEAERKKREAQELREKMFADWAVKAQMNYRDNPYMWAKVQKEERDRLGAMSPEQVRASWAKREEGRRLRNLPTPTHEERERGKELIGKDVTNSGWPTLPRQWYPAGSFTPIELNRENLLRIAQVNRAQFRKFIDVYGSAQVDARLNEGITA